MIWKLFKPLNYLVETFLKRAGTVKAIQHAPRLAELFNHATWHREEKADVTQQDKTLSWLA